MKHVTIFTDAYTGKMTYGRPSVSETCCKECKNYEKQCKKDWVTFDEYPEYPSECDDYVDINSEEDDD